MGTIYLLHFERKYKHVQHYIGYAEHDLMARLDEHAKTLWQRFDQPLDNGNGSIKAGEKHGDGALLLGVINSLGIGFQLVRTWQGDRAVERLLKSKKRAPKFCPICNPQSSKVSLVGHPDQIHCEV
jgi:hypothetical protein